MPNPIPNASSTPKGVRVLMPRNKNVDGDEHNNTTAAAVPSNRSINMSGIAGLDEHGSTILREIDNLKDNLTDRISKIGESVEIVPRLQEEVVDLRAKLELVTEQLKKTNQKSKKERKLPNGVSRLVHDMYRNIGSDENAWKFGESYKSAHNNMVSANLLTLLSEMQLDYSSDDFSRAIKRYFDHLKRETKTPDATKIRRRRNSRRHRLFNARNNLPKVGEDLALWSFANVDAMSDEETDDERRRKVFKRPAWRSCQFNTLVERIDEALGLKRVYSEDPPNRTFDFEKIPEEIMDLS